MANKISEPKKILIFELNWMGDILFSEPLIRAIKETYPESYITCAMVPRYVDLLANNPWVDEIIELSDNRSFLSFFEKIGFLNVIRKKHFDTCIFLKPSRTKVIMAMLSGIKDRIGFISSKRTFFTRVVMADDSCHRVEQILSLAGAMDAPFPRSHHYEYFVTDEDMKKMEVTLASSGYKGGDIIVLNPGGNWGAKRWPQKYFAELAEMLIKKYPGAEIVISGAKKDIGLAGAILKDTGCARCMSLAGKTHIKELAALFKKAKLVISSDSGPMHLASAVGSPTLAIFGPTSAKLTGPYGKGKNKVLQRYVECAVPCYKEKCDKDYVCIKQISAREVFNAACEMME
ncbi:MAG TPA: lipopolysaccharide heptosyltransferase II [Candidatus Omnitrophota bacterium]|nr:lipopolysaccharide heptosyltransferase II [Candidatus Omnitrophota bacterium]HPS19836.1 lipopolysaccharide heptosyltransferase II [Candidatus Omnitrophota bacterium]